MGFVLQGLDKEAYDREYNDRELVRRVLAYFRPHARTMATVAVMIVLGSVTGTAVPILISRGIDALGPEGGQQSRPGLLPGLALVVLLLSG